jgi:hypothetical protein
MIERGERLRGNRGILAIDRADGRENAARYAAARVVTRIMVLDAVLGMAALPFL